MKTDKNNEKIVENVYSNNYAELEKNCFQLIALLQTYDKHQIDTLLYLTNNLYRILVNPIFKKSYKLQLSRELEDKYTEFLRLNTQNKFNLHKIISVTLLTAVIAGGIFTVGFIIGLVTGLWFSLISFAAVLLAGGTGFIALAAAISVISISLLAAFLTLQLALSLFDNNENQLLNYTFAFFKSIYDSIDGQSDEPAEQPDDVFTELKNPEYEPQIAHIAKPEDFNRNSHCLDSLSTSKSLDMNYNFPGTNKGMNLGSFTLPANSISSNYMSSSKDVSPTVSIYDYNNIENPTVLTPRSHFAELFATHKPSSQLGPSRSVPNLPLSTINSLSTAASPQPSPGRGDYVSFFNQEGRGTGELSPTSSFSSQSGSSLHPGNPSLAFSKPIRIRFEINIDNPNQPLNSSPPSQSDSFLQRWLNSPISSPRCGSSTTPRKTTEMDVSPRNQISPTGAQLGQTGSVSSQLGSTNAAAYASSPKSKRQPVTIRVKNDNDDTPFGSSPPSQHSGLHSCKK